MCRRPKQIFLKKKNTYGQYAHEKMFNIINYSVQFSSVTQSCPTFCDPMNRSTPGLPVHHQLPEFTQTHVHRVGDAIQPSHPLSSPFPPALNPSQHQSLFQLSSAFHNSESEIFTHLNGLFLISGVASIFLSIGPV